MCTIAILLEVVDDAPLVVAANRDEMFARPTRPPESLGAHIAGGVDVLSGGTWLAIRRDGGFAAVTNQRAMAAVSPGLRSRGLAVRELAAAADPAAYVAALDPTQYASMNLVWGDARGVSIAYLRREADQTAGKTIEALPPGIHVLCNDRIGAEGFPRGVRLARAIARAPRTWAELAPALQRALADHTRGPSRSDRFRSAAEQGSESPCGEGPPEGEEPGPSHLPPEVARELTATCIHTPAYGTRSATILAARPGETLAYLHADGPPCTAPFVDRMALL
jgi:uncharacterized protein with NRDE domain